MKTTNTIAMLALVAVLGTAQAAGAADFQAGAAKAKEVCAACHGLDGNSPSADFPKLAGQWPDYLAHSLRSYKDGRRKNPVMAGFAAALTAQDIENLAAYYASQPTVLSVRPSAYPGP